MTVADLSPQALAQLEAKLVADLEMVRRVRALLEEHREVLNAPAPQVMASPTPTPVLNQKPAKTIEECVADALETLTDATFRSQDLRQALRKQGTSPDDAGMRLYLNRLLRKGTITVVQAGIGRGGNTYRKQIPPSAAQVSSDSPVSPPESTVSPPIATV